MSPARSGQSGLSLVELVLGLAISAMIMVPLAGMLNNSASAAAISGDRLTLEREAGFAIERITSRVRATKHSVLSPSTNTGNTGGWLSPYSYALEGNALKEKAPNSTRTLSDAVTAFSVTALPVAGGTQTIQVTLTLARGLDTVTASSTVRMGGPR